MSIHLANIQKIIHPGAVNRAVQDSGEKLVAALLLGVGLPLLLPRLTGRVSAAPVALLSTGALSLYAGYCIRSASQRLRPESVRQVAIELYNQDRSVDSIPEGVREEVRAAYTILKQTAVTFFDSDSKRLEVARMLLGFGAHRFGVQGFENNRTGLTTLAILRSAPVGLPEGLMVSGSFINSRFSWDSQIPGDEQISASVAVAALELLRQYPQDLARASWLGEPLTLSQKVPGISQGLKNQALALLGRGRAPSTWISWLRQEAALSVIHGERELASFPAHLQAGIKAEIDALWRDLDARMMSPVYFGDSHIPVLGGLAFKCNLLPGLFSIESKIRFDAIKAHYPTTNVEFTAQEADFLLNTVFGRTSLFVVDPSKSYDGQAIGACIKGGALPEGVRKLKPLSLFHGEKSSWAIESLHILRSMCRQYGWTFPQEYALYDLGERRVKIVFGPYKGLNSPTTRYVREVLLESIPKQDGYKTSTVRDSSPSFSDGTRALYEESRILESCDGHKWTVRTYTNGEPDRVRIQPEFNSGGGGSFFRGPSSI